uniref:Serine incorporator n=1 Tax=Fagus sylvatica TaxID=28930 RepID=A0A2N9GTP5_FAGSY
MDIGESSSSSSSGRHMVFKDSSWFSQFRNGSNPWMARYVYALIFLVATLLAWAARDYGLTVLSEMDRLKGCEGEKYCLGAEGVLRLGDPRDSWHSGWWSVKILMWIAFTIIPFLLPSEFIHLYGGVAHFGAGQIHVILIATTAYVVCLVGIILMYIWYAPEPSCLLNIFFITWTLVLLQFMTSVSLHPKVNAGVLTPGLMGLYVSFVVAVLAIVIATFSTGIDSKCFQFRKDGVQAEDDVPYGYGFFHFVFATGAMYFAMLLIGWNTHHAMRKWTIDVGWTSTWVRIVNEWLAVCVYCKYCNEHQM